MPDVIIRAEGLGKSYRLRHEQKDARYVALRDVLSDKARTLGRRLLGRTDDASAEEEEDFWALRDVSFEVRQGEVLGIIGRNGAGKSTLLKILSRITEPTAGRVRVRGRVASLLEVGTGFHPELTGRENVYLNGAILGMSRGEIRRKFDEIAGFAEVERFLDTPVKRYSSGMYLRLAFAVAAHLEQEILIVDEVLAVGDAEFQKRCLGKIKDVAHTSGRTVLFVSHNMAAIQSLCATTLRLDAGRSRGVDQTEVQVERYLREALHKPLGQAFVRRALSEQLSLDELTLSPSPVEAGQEVHFRLRLASTEPVIAAEICLLVYSNFGVRVAIIDLRRPDGVHRFGPGNPLVIRGRIREVPFVEGDYSIGLYLNAGDVQDDIPDIATLPVVPSTKAVARPSYDARHRGLVELSCEFERETGLGL